MSRVLALFRKGDGPDIREVVSTAGWYPLVILTSLNLVDELDRAVLSVMAPNIRDYFGIDNKTLGAIVGVQVTLLIFASVPIGYLGTRVNRAVLLRWSALIWGCFSAATFWALNLPAFILTRLGAGTGKAAVEPVGKSLLTDYYPPHGWNRVLAVHNAANPLGNIAGPLLAGAIGMSIAGAAAWRWGFLVLTIPTFIALVAARKLREPESQMVKTVSASVLTVTGAPSGMTFRQAVKRLAGIRTFRRQVIGIGVLGFALVGLLAFGSVLYEDEFGVGEGGRGLIGGILATASLLGTILGGRVGERLFAESPERSVRLVGLSIAIFSFFVSIAVFLPSIWMVVAVLWIGVLAISVTVSPLGAVLSAISPPQLRPLMFSMLGLCIGLFGGVAGGVIVGTIADQFGIRWGLASLLPFGVVGGLVMASSASTVNADIDLIEAEMRRGTPADPAQQAGSDGSDGDESSGAIASIADR